MLFTGHEITATRTEMDFTHAIRPTDSELGDWEAELQSEAGLTLLRDWPKLCDHALDFHYVPSSMGALCHWVWGSLSRNPSARCW